MCGFIYSVDEVFFSKGFKLEQMEIHKFLDQNKFFTWAFGEEFFVGLGSLVMEVVDGVNQNVQDKVE